MKIGDIILYAGSPYEIIGKNKLNYLLSRKGESLKKSEIPKFKNILLGVVTIPKNSEYIKTYSITNEVENETLHRSLRNKRRK
jgi:hypothetical protein